MQVLGFDLLKSGIFSVLPWITMAVFANVGGWLADTMVSRGVSVTLVRKVMQTVRRLAGLSLALNDQYIFTFNLSSSYKLKAHRQVLAEGALIKQPYAAPACCAGWLAGSRELGTQIDSFSSRGARVADGWVS